MLEEMHRREKERLAALDRYDILDTPSEISFDRITQLACRLFDVPMSTITLIDGHRQWFKSRQGTLTCETSRKPALCDIVVREAKPLIVPETWADERFIQNPFVIGDPYIRFYAGMPLCTLDGFSIGTLCVMDTKPRTFNKSDVEALYNISQIVMNELELRRLATTDGLTGALSRRAFHDEFSRAFSLALRHKHDLSCIMLDLDHFKHVNDTYGHPTGDVVLTEVVEACRQELRKSDVMGRLGGEEFGVLLPHTGVLSAMNVAEKLRTAVERLRPMTISGPLKVTASFGIGALDISIKDIESLLQRADTALYAAKSAGRNRCLASIPVETAARQVRRRVLKAGQITFNGGRSVIDCTVRSLSDEAATLKVVTSAGIPETFKLGIVADEFSRLCCVVRKTDQEVEVNFFV